jgi:hypothetical protein
VCSDKDEDFQRKYKNDVNDCCNKNIKRLTMDELTETSHAITLPLYKSSKRICPLRIPLKMVDQTSSIGEDDSNVNFSTLLQPNFSALRNLFVCVGVSSLKAYGVFLCVFIYIIYFQVSHPRVTITKHPLTISTFPHHWHNHL